MNEQQPPAPDLGYKPTPRPRNALEGQFTKYLREEVWVPRVLVGTTDQINALYDRQISEATVIRNVQVLPVIQVGPNPNDICNNVPLLLATYEECQGVKGRGGF